MKCIQCGAEIDNDSVFCPECGAKCGQEQQLGGQQMVFCPNCGQQMEADSVFCPNCGQPVTQNKGGKFGGKNIKKIIIPAAAAVVVLVAAVGVGSKILGIFTSKGDDEIYNKEKLLYVKDDSLFHANLKKLKKDPLEYTDELRDSGVAYGFSGILRSGASFTKDGKYCFYPERLDEYDNFRLMRIKTGSKDEGEKVDSDVSYYSLTDSGDVVYKKDNGSLYYWDGKDKTKLDSDITSFGLSEDGKAVMWDIMDDDGTYDVYYQKLGKKGEKVKVESGVSQVIGNNDDYSKIYYIKNDSFYVIENQEEKTKLAGDVEDIYCLDADKGTFYYAEMSTDTARASDFVIDDIGQDQNSYRWDRLRESLDEREITINRGELYYYNGKEEVLVSENVEDIYRSFKSDDYVGCVFAQTEEDEMPEMRLSEISYAGDVESMLLSETGEKTYYLALKGEVTPLDDLEGDKSYRIVWASEKNALYIYDQDEDGGDLITISCKKPGESQLVDEDVEGVAGQFGGNVYYYKDLDRDGYSGDLYRDGEMVLSDVAVGSLTTVPDSSMILCITDGSDNKHRGTLTSLKDGKDENIADDVTYFDAIGEKAVVMLTDYNSDKRRGDLKYFKGKDCETVDTDVSGFYAIGNTGRCP